MRYDKAGNYDGAHGLPRRVIGNPLAQSQYHAHYDRALELLREGATVRQIMYFDPDLTRPIEDYLKCGR